MASTGAGHASPLSGKLASEPDRAYPDHRKVATPLGLGAVDPAQRAEQDLA